MDREVAHRRIAALHGHLTVRVEGDVQDPILSTQDCAATGTLRYARACAEDLCFARVSAPSAREVNVERTALQFADHTLLALQKSNSDRFASIPEPPAYARPALGEKTKDHAPAPPLKQQRPAVRNPAARLRPEVARALIRASAQQQQHVAQPQQQRAGEAAFANPRLTAGWTPKVDAVETASHYQLEIALPGVRKEDLRVELWGPFLTVSGKRASFGSGRPEQRASGRALVVRRRELDHGFFSATWKLPAKGNLDSLYAESVDGVLRIYVRKRRVERRF